MVSRADPVDTCARPGEVGVRLALVGEVRRFDSYDDAMQHSESAATHERIAKIGSLMKGETSFYNLVVIDEMNP